MQVYHQPESLPETAKGAVLALGNFDGVHRGHQAVIGETVKLARERQVPAGAMTFDPHPRQFFQPNTSMFVLTPTPTKLTLLEALGLDVAGVMVFNSELASLSGEAFVRNVLHHVWQVSHVVIGYNFFFGKGRSGSPQLLQEMGADLGFAVSVIAPESDDGEVFSSSAVRELLRSGDVRGAGEMLGHWWQVTGVVESGAGRGTGLGYPTANVMLAAGQDLHHGIYAARVRVDGRSFDAAAYNGRRPTFDNGISKLEVFLFDFDERLYGREIGVELIDFIRPDMAFDTPEDLVRQMDDDCARARDVLAEINNADPMLNYAIAKATGESITTAR